MHRTTIKLNDDLFQRLEHLSVQENRSTPNLVETILMRYLDNDLLADSLEMDEIRRDEGLKKSIQKGLSDYRAKRGKFV